eukprot:365326-Chlamydomonas_euryale.AAC.2
MPTPSARAACTSRPLLAVFAWGIHMPTPSARAACTSRPLLAVFSQGIHVEQNFAAAKAHFEAAAAADVSAAHNGLGAMHWTGEGVPQNLTAAFEVREHPAQGARGGRGLLRLRCGASDTRKTGGSVTWSMRHGCVQRDGDVVCATSLCAGGSVMWFVRHRCVQQGR